MYFADIDDPSPRMHMRRIYVEDTGNYLVIHGATASGRAMQGEHLRIPKNGASVNALIDLLRYAMAGPLSRLALDAETEFTTDVTTTTTKE